MPKSVPPEVDRSGLDLFTVRFMNEARKNTTRSIVLDVGHAHW